MVPQSQIAHRIHDLLEPGIVAVVTGRHSQVEAVARIAPDEVVVSPVLQRERRIHHDPIEGHQLVAVV